MGSRSNNGLAMFKRARPRVTLQMERPDPSALAIQGSAWQETKALHRDEDEDEDDAKEGITARGARTVAVARTVGYSRIQ